MSFSDYLENEILNHLFGGADYARPATVYLALVTAAPNDASTGDTIVEADYTGYARLAIINDAVQWPASVAGQKQNGAVLIFPECTAGQSDVTHFALLDAALGGNILGYGALAGTLQITAGDIVRFGVGDILISLD